MEPRHRRNLNVLLPCLVVLGIMFGLVAYSPELYRAFCGATGYGGTTQRAYSDPTATSDKIVTVAFDSNVAPDLPWRFEPEQRSVTVHLGEQKLVFFTAENLSNESIVAHATFNVTPETSRHLFQQDSMLLFQRGAPRSASESRNARRVLCRSGICERFRQRPCRHDHAQLYVVALGQTPIRPRIFRGSRRMPRRMPSMESSFSPNAAPPVTRWTATRPDRCWAACSAARPAPLLATIIRRRSRAPLSPGRRTVSISGWPTPRNLCPAHECRFACSTLRLDTTSSLTCRRSPGAQRPRPVRTQPYLVGIIRLALGPTRCRWQRCMARGFAASTSVSMKPIA